MKLPIAFQLDTNGSPVVPAFGSLLVGSSSCCGSSATQPARSLVQLESTLTCPQCGHVSQETMPTDACVYFYECAGCHAVLKPLAGDCCVFCSYGSVPCPPIQAGRACC